MQEFDIKNQGFKVVVAVVGIIAVVTIIHQLQEIIMLLHALLERSTLV